MLLKTLCTCVCTAPCEHYNVTAVRLADYETETGTEIRSQQILCVLSAQQWKS